MRYIKSVTPAFVKRSYHRLRSFFRRGIVTCNVRGVKIKIGVSSETELFRVNTYSTKEPDTLDWVDANLRDGDVMFDIGANIGLYALYAAKRNPRSTVYAFEPAFQNFASLCRNIALNALTNVVPCNTPLADRQAFDFFVLSDIQPGAALNSFGGASEFHPGADSQTFRQGALSDTLDAMVQQHGLPQPNLIKIDVDGLEGKILEGASNILQMPQLRSVQVEWNYQTDDAIRLLEQKMSRRGLKPVSRSQWVWQQGNTKAQNFVFQRN